MNKRTFRVKDAGQVIELSRWLTNHFKEKNFPVRVTVERYVKRRSTNQNSLMHKWFEEIAEQVGDTPKSVKADLKAKFLPEVFNKDLEVSRIKGTHELNVQEMSDFLQQIEMLAANMPWILTRPEQMQ